MRLLVRRIYRAFPELDRFSDDQCRRFVKAANRGWRRGVHWALICVLLTAGGLGSLWAANKAFEASEEYQNSQRHDVIWADITAGVSTIPLFILTVLVALVVRDLLLRLRIGRILRRDSACPKCHYRLVGLAVSKQSTIKCPECGFEATVDPALSALAINAEGKEEFLPAIIAPASQFWTRKRVRLLVRAMVLMFLTPVVLWGCLMYWVERQVRAATAWKPPPLSSIVESLQPPGVPADGPDGWAALDKVLATVRGVDAEEWGSLGLPYNAHPLLILIDPAEAAQLSPAQAQDAAARARRMLEQYQSHGVYDRLRDLAACRRAVRPAVQSWILARMMSYGSVNVLELADICAVRMELARRSGETKEFIDALEARLALARVLRLQLDGQMLQMGASIETATFTDLEGHLATHPSKEWLDAVDAVIGRQCTPPPTTHLFDGDEAGLINIVRDTYIQIGEGQHPEVRFLEASYEAYRARGRIGSFDENRDTIAGYMKSIEAFASQPPFKRSGPAPALPASPLVMLRYFFPDESLVVQALDESLLHRRAYETLSALERFRLAHGDYPQKLDELVPGFLKALPEDPWSGRPLGYVRVDPAKDGQKRSFLLYSVGADRTDNGGAWFPQQIERVHLIEASPGKGVQGSDYIINERPERP